MCALIYASADRRFNGSANGASSQWPKVHMRLIGICWCVCLCVRFSAAMLVAALHLRLSMAALFGKMSLNANHLCTFANASTSHTYVNTYACLHSKHFLLIWWLCVALSLLPLIPATRHSFKCNLNMRKRYHIAWMPAPTCICKQRKSNNAILDIQKRRTPT